MRPTSEGPIGVGTTLQVVTKRGQLTARVVEYQLDGKITLEFTEGPIKGSKLSYAVVSGSKGRLD